MKCFKLVDLFIIIPHSLYSVCEMTLHPKFFGSCRHLLDKYFTKIHRAVFCRVV